MATKKLKFKVTVNPDLEQYTDKVLFPEQVERATEILRKTGLPVIPEPKKP